MTHLAALRLAAIVCALAAVVSACSGGNRVDVFALCGNGSVDPGEQCDEGAMNSDAGACLTTCQSARCGDTFVDLTREECDGTNLRTRSCASLGFDGGVLACSPSCRFDTSMCGTAFTPSPTPTPTSTPTPTPEGRCSNGFLDEGETCAACPADCVVQPCTAASPTVTVQVNFIAPAADDALSAIVLVGYQSDLVSLPGAGSAPGSRVKNRLSNSIVQVNDLDYALQVEVSRFSGRIPSGRLVTADFDACDGAPGPTAADFGCSVMSCSNAFGPVDGCRCTVSTP
jgi:hypothetical protein